MNYRKKDIVIGFILIAMTVGGFYFYKNLKVPKALPTPTPSTTKSDIQGLFDYVIPEDLASIELKDVSGGDGRGIATNKEILVDIKDPDSGYFYEAWLQGSNDQDIVSLGKMHVAKGGWLLEYNGAKYPEYKKIIISLEKKFDSTLEKKILEGSF